MRIAGILTIVLMACCVVYDARAQDPFNIIGVETVADDTTRVVRIRMTGGDPRDLEYGDVKASAEGIALFQGEMLGFSFNGEDQIPDLALNVLQYRLSVYSRVVNGHTDRYYLPLVVMTRLHTDYEKPLTPVDDATSYSGGPLTLRAMPALTTSIGAENMLSVGAIGDVRFLAHKDATSSSELEWDVGVYLGIGATYSGPGEVRDEAGQTWDGRWAASLLGFTFLTSEATMDELFANRNTPFGMDFIFRYRALDKKAQDLNLYASFRLLSNPPIGTGDKYIVRLAIGN